MSPKPTTPDPLPDDFAQMLQSWRESRVVLTALELDVFTAIGVPAGGGSGAAAPEVARRIHADARGTDALLHALAAIGLLVKRGETFANGPLAARFLSGDSPQSRRAGMLHNANLWHRWTALTEVVRTGLPASRGPRDDEDASTFIAAMHDNATARAPQLVAALDLSGVRRVLDVGGGSGAYSIAFARAVPGLVAVVLDQAEVVPLTARYAAEAGVSDRVTTRVGDLNADDFGTGYDLVLIAAICHMNDRAQNADLIRRAARALAPGGRLAVSDYVMSADRTAPKAGALFAINMLVNTRGGSNYTEADYAGWMRDAGLADPKRIPLTPAISLMVGTKR